MSPPNSSTMFQFHHDNAAAESSSGVVEGDEDVGESVAEEAVSEVEDRLDRMLEF